MRLLLIYKCVNCQFKTLTNSPRIQTCERFFQFRTVRHTNSMRKMLRLEGRSHGVRSCDLITKRGGNLFTGNLINSLSGK